MMIIQLSGLDVLSNLHSLPKRISPVPNIVFASDNLFIVDRLTARRWALQRQTRLSVGSMRQTTTPLPAAKNLVVCDERFMTN